MYPNLKLELWRRGIRQNRLAKTLGMDESLLSRIVNGFRSPDAGTRARIAEALGCAEQWLFDEAGTAAEPSARTGAVHHSNAPGAAK